MANYEVENNAICFKVERKIYPMEVIFGACYNFIDRCYVFLDKGEKETIRVSLKGKQELAEADLEALAGEFHNELLTQSLRKKINKQNKKVREFIVSRALYSVEPYEEQEIAEPEEALGEEEDFLDDPLQIAVPWDEKYGKKDEEGKEEVKDKSPE